MGLFFFKKKVMRAALLLCALLAAPAVAPIGRSRGCATDCPPTQPKGCCTLSDGKTPWMYPGCTKECITAVPNYCEGGTCKACPFGSYINSMQQTKSVVQVVGSSANVKVTNGYGGKEICASPPSCPAGTYFPVDEFGLYKGISQTTGTAPNQVTTFSFRTTTPCVKCGLDTNKPGPTQTITWGTGNVEYQPDAGAVSQSCQTCPDGKYADKASCKNKDGADIDCGKATAVTAPTRCKDCPADTYTVQGKNQGCITKEQCIGPNDGKGRDSSNFMVDGKVCKPTCAANQWLQTKFCPDPDSNGDNGKCDSSMCRDAAAGTTLSEVDWNPQLPYDSTGPTYAVTGRKFDTECAQKYNDQVQTPTPYKEKVDCKSVVFDDTVAKATSVGISTDVESVTKDLGGLSYIAAPTYGSNGNYKQMSQYVRSKQINNMQAMWCTSPGYANVDSKDPTKCTQCPPNTYSAGGFVTATGYEEENNAFKRFKFPTGLEPPSCTACPEGKFSPYGAAECTEDCPPGSALSDGKCTMCEVGKFSAVANSKECTACAEGKFSGAPYTGDMTQKEYGPGRYFQQSLNVSGATRCGNCYHEPAGADQGWNGFRKVVTSDGVTNCSLCPAGKFLFYGNADGQTEDGREIRDARSNVVFAGKLYGENFPVRMWRSANVNEASDPSLFPAAKCMTCPPGTFSNMTTMLHPEGGWNGKKGDVPYCWQCPPDSVPSMKQDSCTVCPEGTKPGPIGFIYTPMLDRPGVHCMSDVPPTIMLIFDILMSLLHTLYSCTGDKYCCGSCKSETRINMPSKVLAFIWCIGGIICLAYTGTTMLIGDTLLFGLWPFAWLCCCSYLFVFNKVNTEAEGQWLSDKNGDAKGPSVQS